MGDGEKEEVLVQLTAWTDTNSSSPLLGEGEVLALCWHGAHGPVCNPDETHPVVKNKRHGRGRETSWKENWEEWGGYKRGQ